MYTEDKLDNTTTEPLKAVGGVLLTVSAMYIYNYIEPYVDECLNYLQCTLLGCDRE